MLGPSLGCRHARPVLQLGQGVSAVLESMTGALQSKQLQSCSPKGQNLECLSAIKRVTPIEENSQKSYFHDNFNNVPLQNEAEKLEMHK